MSKLQKRVHYNLGSDIDADVLSGYMLALSGFTSYAGKPPNEGQVLFRMDDHPPVLKVTGHEAEIINEYGTMGMEEDFKMIRKVLDMLC